VTNVPEPGTALLLLAALLMMLAFRKWRTTAMSCVAD
jgi:hypothetical protein